MVKMAQDFERKLKPWKQARERLLPLSVTVPPKMVPSFGKGDGNMEKLHPAATTKTFCQCR